MSEIPKAKKSLSDIWKLKQRGKRDSDRHKKLINDAIKKNGKDLITEYNIITSDGDKKIKIPIRFLDRYKFKYGKLKDKGKTGQGLDVKPGDKFRLRKRKEEGGKPDKPSKEEGEAVFEAEVTIDEIVDILLKELNLPWMEPDKSSAIEVETEDLSSIEKKGILPNLDIKKTLFENIKRNAAKGSPKIGGINENDLRYRNWETNKEYHSNAAVYLMMDRSGSMSEEKTYIAKSFYFWMVQFLKRRYQNISLVFIAHDARAFLVDEKDFFKVSSSGGTLCSTAFEMAYEHIQANHPPSSWNNYVFEFSDGDNWGDDNLRVLEFVRKLLPLVRAMGYGEIVPEGDFSPWMNEENRLSAVLDREINRTRFVSIRIGSREEVFDALKAFFNVDNSAKKMVGGV
ncbi:sporulation protein YhbH [Candidatus Pacearchaeota archaeon]|nr:sporulation protein YhbH [Candidatus Pacearchaeota archaeon]